MAIFHLNAKVISRGKGQSAIAAAAYRSGERLRDEQTAEQKFYQTRAERIAFTDILAPKDAPEWAHDRNALWNHAERAEKRKDGQLAREIEVSLPHELTGQQREWLVKDFAREAFVRKGYAVDIAIHAPDKDSDKRNHHAHLMVTMRTLGVDGFAVKKDPAMNRREQLGEWREQFAHLTNRHLERHGHDIRVDHRSLEAQGIVREPTMHVGYAGHEIAARGAQSDRMDELRAILARNEICIDLKALDQEMRQLEQEKAEQQRRDEQAARDATKAADAARAEAAVKSLQERLARAAVVADKAGADRQAAEQAMQRLGRADEEARRHPAAQAFAQGAKQEAQQIRQDVCAEQREQRFWTQQEAWRARSAAKAPAPSQPVAAPVAKGLQVMDRATGALSKLGDFVVDFLAGPSAPSPDKKPDMKAFINDPAARKQQQLARLAAIQNDREAAAAIERIAQDMEKGKALNAQDVRKLTYQHQQQIRTFGDSAVQQMVDEARKRSESYWKGNERERER